MDRLVRSITQKQKRDRIQLIAYSSTDRGSRFVHGQANVETAGKDKKQLDEEVAAAISKLLAGQ